MQSISLDCIKINQLNYYTKTALQKATKSYKLLHLVSSINIIQSVKQSNRRIYDNIIQQ